MYFNLRTAKNIIGKAFKRLPALILANGGIFKMNGQKNCSIQCTIKECAHNMQSENYCTLDVISVGTHEPNPTKAECTDCKSFVMKSSY
jgi:hypothetical protein